MKAIMPPQTDRLPRKRGSALLGVFAILFGLHCLTTPVLTAETNLKLLSKPDVKQYEAAFRAAKRGQWTTVDQIAKRGRSKLPRKLLRWLDMKQRGTTASFDDITTFIRQNPEWLRMRWLQR
ncbi:MAG: hypothetical protein ACPGPC_07420 [Alphaproteobacteria bacterium]